MGNVVGGLLKDGKLRGAPPHPPPAHTSTFELLQKEKLHFRARVVHAVSLRKDRVGIMVDMRFAFPFSGPDGDLAQCTGARQLLLIP
jgi:hypothetical protein